MTEAENEIADILQEWDAARGLSGPTPTRVGKETIAKAGSNLRLFLTMKSFEPWKERLQRALDKYLGE